MVVRTGETCLLQELPFYKLNNWEVLIEYGLENEIWGSNKYIELYKCLNKADWIDSFSFRYVTDSEFNRLNDVVNNRLELCCIHFNIRSLNANVDLLREFLCGIQLNFDVIVLSEIWTTNIEFYNNIMTGYNFFYDLPLKGVVVGGVGIYVRQHISVLVRPDLKIAVNPEALVEDIWLELKVNSQKYIVGGIYRHPGQDINPFTDRLEKTMDLVVRGTVPCIILGDININLMSYNSNTETTQYLDMISIHGFLPVILMPTRFTETSATLLDHVYYYSGSLSSPKINSGNFLVEITDHLPNYILIFKSKFNRIIDRPYKRLFSPRNKLKFSLLLKQIDWEKLIPGNLTMDQAYSIFDKEVKRSFNTAFPLVRISRKAFKDKLWVTKGIRISSAHKNRLYRDWLKQRTTQRELKYKNYRNCFRKVSKMAITSYYRDFFQSNANNAKKIWTQINTLCSFNVKKNGNKSPLTHLNIDNKVVNNPTEMANGLNDYFCNIGSGLASKLGKAKHDFAYYMGSSLENSIYCEEINREELISVIQGLNPRKSPGYDQISPLLIKDNVDNFVQPLLMIYNLSLTTGKVPVGMKVAKVIPLFKKGDRSIMTNYRPISLLSVFVKILEKLIYSRVMNFLKKYSVLYKYQFGFRKGYSTNLALIDIIDAINMSLDNDEYVVGIFCDLQKAFDTVNHEILLSKLNNYGIRGTLHAWFADYLKNRKQVITINGVSSRFGLIACGVPQGSVLGPLLFLLYVNDMPNAVPGSDIRLFADDTNIFFHASNMTDLQVNTDSALKNLSDWFLANKMSFNKDKTSYMFFNFKKKSCSDDIGISMDDVKLLRESSYKYLGVIIDDQLTWNQHIDHIISKIKRFIGIFFRLRNKLSSVCLKDLFFALIYPHLLYGVEIYSTANKSVLNRLNICINRILRTLQCAPLSTPVTSLYKNYNLLPITEMRKFQILCVVYKCVNMLDVPLVFQDYFQLNADVHHYYTRNSNNTFIPKFLSSKGLKTTRYCGAKWWHDLPSYLRCISSYPTFKRLLKLHLADSHCF